MRLNFTCLFLLITLAAAAQEFSLQCRLTDEKNNPVADAYILNISTSSKCFSNGNGIFEVNVKPADTLLITHISYLRKVITVFELLKNPVVRLETDTLSIKPVNVTGTLQTAHDQAMKNINYKVYDVMPRIGDNFSETERSLELMKNENRVMRTEASSVKITSFSLSVIIGKIAEKRKKRKEASTYDSTRKLPKAEKKDEDEK